MLPWLTSHLLPILDGSDIPSVRPSTALIKAPVAVIAALGAEATLYPVIFCPFLLECKPVYCPAGVYNGALQKVGPHVLVEWL